MEFNELRDQVLNNAKGYREKHGLEIDLDFASLKLGEEVGEYFQAVLIHQQKSRKEKRVPEEESKHMVGQELADVVGLAMIAADVLGIDLEEAVTKKWNNNLNIKP